APPPPPTAPSPRCPAKEIPPPPSPRGGPPTPACGRRLDDHRLVRIDDRRVGALQPLHAAVVAAHIILADLSCLAAGEPERRHPAVTGQDGAFHPPHEAAEAARGVSCRPIAAA